MSSIETLIGSLGFPVAVCVWLLYERSKSLQQLSDVISKNTEVIQKLVDKLDDKV